MRQMTLDLHLNERINFDSFIVGDNAELISAIKNLFTSTEFCWYLWGESGAGRSHLLQACAAEANQKKLTAYYISLSEHKKMSPDMLLGLEQYSLVLWDDVDAVAGKSDWEIALFHAYNQLQISQAKLICTATAPPLSTSFQLADLRSRLAAAITYQIKLLADEDKILALQQRATSRGMHLNNQVGHYLLTHYSRDISALFSFLDQLDAASLEEKRLLTIPFVKSVLQE